MTLLIDRLAEAAERDPASALLWRRSGGAASWLIAQGYGPGGKSLATESNDAVLVLGALRAGAMIDAGGVPLPANVTVEALAAIPVDAAVAERRLHIMADTLVRPGVRHGDLKSLEQAFA